MKDLKLYTAAKAAILYTSVMLFTTSLFAQTDAKKETSVSAASTVNTQTANRKQNGSWTVGIDQGEITVQTARGETNPLAVKVVGDGPVETGRLTNRREKQ